MDSVGFVFSFSKKWDRKERLPEMGTEHRQEQGKQEMAKLGLGPLRETHPALPWEGRPLLGWLESIPRIRDYLVYPDIF